MQIMKALFIFVSTLAPMMLHAADGVPPDNRLSMAELIAHPKDSDGQLIRLKGIYFADLMGAPHFYVTREDALADKERDAVDLIFSDEYLRSGIKDSDPVCLVLTGTFSTYDHGHILIGLISKYGLLRVQSIERC